MAISTTMRLCTPPTVRLASLGLIFCMVIWSLPIPFQTTELRGLLKRLESVGLSKVK